MTGYITIKHPVTGEEIQAVPTGKVNEFKAEVVIITPDSNLDKTWITQDQLVTNT